MTEMGYVGGLSRHHNKRKRERKKHGVRDFPEGFFKKLSAHGVILLVEWLKTFVYNTLAG